jgi:hypothetical protein
MARIRTVKPEFWQDEDLAALNPFTQLMAIGLLNHADDYGYFKAHKALVRAAVFPFSEPSLNIHGMLIELSSIDYISLFEGSDGKPYGFINGFSKHQKVNRPTPSKIEPLRQFNEGSVSTHGGLTAGTGNREQGKEQGTGSVREPELNTNNVAKSQNTTVHTKQDIPEFVEAPEPELSIFQRSVQETAQTTGGRVVNFKRAAQETQMTPDWQPDQHIMVQLQQKAIPLEFINEVRQNFLNYHIEKASTSNTWSSRFATWVKKDWAEKSNSWQQQQNGAVNNSTASASLGQLMDNDW